MKLYSDASPARPMRSEPWRGSRFYADPVCTHILKTPRLPSGRLRAGGSRERLLTPLCPPRFASFPSKCNTRRLNRVVGRFQEPPVCPEPFRWLDNVSEIRRLFAGSAQVTGNLHKRLPSRRRPRRPSVVRLSRTKVEARQRSSQPPYT